MTRVPNRIANAASISAISNVLSDTSAARRRRDAREHVDAHRDRGELQRDVRNDGGERDDGDEHGDAPRSAERADSRSEMDVAFCCLASRTSRSRSGNPNISSTSGPT
jgi:hypothetical protein